MYTYVQSRLLIVNILKMLASNHFPAEGALDNTLKCFTFFPHFIIKNNKVAWDLSVLKTLDDLFFFPN